MAMLSPSLVRLDDATPNGGKAVGRYVLAHWCPACRDLHRVTVDQIDGPGRARPSWSWNGDAFYPTLSPSVRVVYGMGGDRPDRCCHYFLRSGTIQFCADCTHDLAGQHVPLPAIPAGAAAEF